MRKVKCIPTNDLSKEIIGDQRFLSMAPENIGKLLAAFIIQGGVKREH